MSSDPSAGQTRGRTAFVALAGVALTFLVLFFQVVRPYFLPLFLAAVLALLCQPTHRWLTDRLGRRPTASAAVLALLLFLLVVGPGALATYLAWTNLDDYLSRDAANGAAAPSRATAVSQAIDWVCDQVPVDRQFAETQARNVVAAVTAEAHERALAFAKNLPGALLLFVVFLIAFFFFLKDGDRLVHSWEGLTPLRLEQDRQIRAEFATVCRGVVWGTVVAALAQGLLFSIGLLVIDLAAGSGLLAWVVPLGFLTSAFAMVPFAGAACVWAPTAVYFFFTGHVAAGVAMAVYGAGVVSTVDNVIKVWLIGDTAKLHPVVVFVSVLGGIEMVGLLGVFVGPIVAAVLYSVMKILKKELGGQAAALVVGPTAP